jgi:hypothetical protein
MTGKYIKMVSTRLITRLILMRTVQLMEHIIKLIKLLIVPTILLTIPIPISRIKDKLYRGIQL